MHLISRALLSCLGLLFASPAFADGGQANTQAAFGPCEDSQSHFTLRGSECATVAVPLDHQDAAGGTIDLFVRKFPASRPSAGQFWMIAGGPGESGASFYPMLETIRAAVPHLDLIIPDHRGTGFSTRLCSEEESPGSTGGAALEGSEWGSCFGALNADPERARSFSISNAAHDLNLLMEQFGTTKPRYLYGVSYGTQLVLRTLAVAPPNGLDGVILDSLVPPEDSQVWDLSHRSAVVDAVGREVLRECERRDECRQASPGSLEDEFQALLADANASELIGPTPKYLFGALLDLPGTRAMIPQIIAGLRAGDPAPLERAKAQLADLGAVFAQYPQAPASIPLVSLISRSENNARPALTAEQVSHEEEAYLFASPLPSQLLNGGIPSYARDESFAVQPTKMPPTLVLHGDLDPKTSYEGALEHVALLESAGPIGLVTVHGAPHFLLMTAPDCFEESLRRFVSEGHREDSVCEPGY